MEDIETSARVPSQKYVDYSEVVLSGVAHMVSMEKPEEVNRLVREFLVATARE